MTKYIVSFSAGTIFAGTIIAAFCVAAICFTCVVCSFPSASHKAGPRILNGRDIVQPHDYPLGSMEAIKEAQLNQEYGPVDKTKLHERKEGFFQRLRMRRAAACAPCNVSRPSCSQASYVQRVYINTPSPLQPPYYLPYEAPRPAPEPMPQIDPSTWADGHVALKPRPATENWLAPYQYPQPSYPTYPICPNCNRR